MFMTQNKSKKKNQPHNPISLKNNPLDIKYS